MTNNIRSLTIKFNCEIQASQIPQFRGAIVAAMEGLDCMLMHNHKEDGLRYKYPLVQYKRIASKAAIVCIGEGTSAIGAFFSNANFNIRILDKIVNLQVEDIRAEQTNIQAEELFYEYQISRWLPLNQENYKAYQSLDALAQKCEFLERILVGNILSFTKGLDIHLDRELNCNITNLEQPRILTFKGVKMMAFDVTFKSNISLPNWIGLGKGVSHGFGTVTKRIKHKTNK